MEEIEGLGVGSARGPGGAKFAPPAGSGEEPQLKARGPWGAF